MTVTAAPAVTQGAVSMADKVTAAAITVIVAGTVSVGAVAIQHTQKPSKPTPVTASPAPAAVGAGDRRDAAAYGRSRSSSRTTRPHHKPADQTQGGQGQTGTVVPVETPTDSPSPTDPSPTPGPVTPPPPPPAPAWTGAFTTSGGLAATSLSPISQRVTGPHNDQMLFGEVMQGALVDKHDKSVGTVYVDFGGSIAGANGSLSSLWLWIDTPEGTYRYAAGGNLKAATQADDGSTTYVFSGGYQPLERARDARHTGPARRDHLHLAWVLGRWVAVRDQRLHGRILSENTPRSRATLSTGCRFLRWIVPTRRIRGCEGGWGQEVLWAGQNVDSPAVSQ